MEESLIRLQYARLVRHHDDALLNMDPISFLDLAHVLRVWADMKREVDVDMSARAPDTKLPMPLSRAGEIRRIAHGTKYMYAPVFYGVNTPNLKMQGLTFIQRAIGPEDVKKMYESSQRPSVRWEKVTLTNWFGAEICEFGNMGTPETKRVGLSREMLIRRVANILGGSHPEKPREPDLENRFDPVVLQLHSYKVANGYPLTYYLLLEIAVSLIDGLRALYGSNIVGD